MSPDIVKIRKYRDTDYDVCRSLWVELVRFHMDIYKTTFAGGRDPGRGFDEYIKNPNRKGTWVAEYGGKVVGLGGFLISPPEHSAVEPMVVSEKYRGKGISGALMKRIIAEVRKSGMRFLSVQPGVRNKGAFNAYVRLGFKNVWTIELIQEINPPGRGIRWRPGLKIHDNELGY